MKLELRFPKRGNPPPDQPGYEREKGDPFVFHRCWKSCWFHGLTEEGIHACALLAKRINQNDCDNCLYRAEVR